MKKRIVSILLCLALVLSLLPAGLSGKAAATEPEETTFYDTQLEGISYRVYPQSGYAAVIGTGGAVSEQVVTVDSQVDGHPVTTLAENAFAGCAMELLYLPDSILHIEKNAISGCPNLYYIRMSENLENITATSIMGCDSLHYLYLPRSVKTCEGLYQEDRFSDCVIWIIAFEGSFAAEEIARWGRRILFKAEPETVYVNTSTALYSIEDGEAVFRWGGPFPSTTDPYIYVIPDEVFGCPVTRVAGYSNLDNHLYTMNLVLGQNVKILEANVFSPYSFPKTLYIPASVTSIADAHANDALIESVIYGHAGTYGEEFARENGLEFHDVSGVPFRDTPKDSWYYDYVYNVYWFQIMNGTSDTTFEPNGVTSRAMVVKVLANLSGVESFHWSYGFTDVPEGQWYTDAVNWGKYYGIVNGTSDTTFSPNAPVTREQFAAFLYRYATACGFDCSARADLSGYTDQKNISSYANDAISWAVAEGIINGSSPTTLNPRNHATRAEMAAMLIRFLAATG